MKSDLTKILNEAWRITFKNKWLWVFGLVLVLSSSAGRGSGGGGGGGNNTPKSTNSINTDQFFNNKNSNPVFPQPKELLDKTTQVLGATTVSVQELLSTISPIFILTFILILLCMIGLFFYLGLYIQGWATSAIIHGIDQENNGTSLGLSEMSKMGKTKAVEMMKLKFIPGFLLFLSILVIFLPLVFLMVMESSRTLGILLSILVFLIAFIAGVIVMVSTFLGSFSLVLKNKTWKQAFGEGFRIFSKYLVDVVILGFVNCLLGVVVSLLSCLLVIPLGLVSGAAVLGMIAFPPIGIVIIPIAFIVILILISAMTLIGAIFQVFNESTWVLLYKQLISLEETVPTAQGAI